MSFADLGISKPVVDALAKRDITEPFPGPEDGHQRRARRPRPAGPVADRLGQDPRLRHPDGRPDRARQGPSPALVLAPTRELASQIVDELDSIARARGLQHRRRLRRRRLRPAERRRPQGRHRRRHPRPARGPDRARRDLARPRSRSSSSTRPTACSTWASSRPSAGSSPRPRTTRQTLFFSATLEGATGKLAAAYTRDARRHTQEPPERKDADIEHRFVHVESQSAKLDHLIDELQRRRARPHARLRPHQARRRPPGQAPAQPRRRRGRDARRQEPAPARTGAGPLRERRRRDADRDRRRRPRHRRRRRHPRGQLRRPRRPRHLRAPDRPHRPRRAHAAPASASCSPTRPTRCGAIARDLGLAPSSTAPPAARPERGRSDDAAARQTTTPEASGNILRRPGDDDVAGSKETGGRMSRHQPPRRSGPATAAASRSASMDGERTGVPETWVELRRRAPTA